MKKLIIICLLFIDIIIIIMYVNLYRNYNSSNLELVNKLNGEDYEIFMNNMNNEKENIISEIENNIGYEFNDVDSFGEIMIQLEEDHNELSLLNVDLSQKKESLSNQKKTLQNIYN